MKKGFAIFLAVLCSILAASGAFAESITLSGSVVPAETIRVYAPVSGTVEEVRTEAGQKVSADETLYTMKTSKVYAESDGKVAGIFGQPGDNAETVSTNYGAVLYLEGAVRHTVSATIDSAYTSAETKFVHTGGEVYMVSRSNTARKGSGIISAVSGNSYTVQVTEGNLLHGDSVDIYLDPGYTYEQKIGRGSVSRNAPVAVTAAGGIVRIAVENGEEVKRGDLLLETLDGTYDGYTMDGTEIRAGRDGVAGSVQVTPGTAVEKGSVAAEIYPQDRMRVEAYVPEAYAGKIREGDDVVIEMDIDSQKSYPGKIVLLSETASSESREDGTTEISYRIVAEFVPDETIRFGMTALMTIGQEDEPEAEPEEETVPEEKPAEAGQTEDPAEEGWRRPEWPADRERPEMPEGWTPGDGRPGMYPPENWDGEAGEAAGTTEGINP